MKFRVRIYWTEKGHTVTEEIRLEGLSPRHAIYEAVKSERFPRNIEDAESLCIAAARAKPKVTTNRELVQRS